MRYPALQGKRDDNEPAIIAALERVGATVEQIPTGRGVPDLLVGFCGANFLLECKTLHGKLNQKQRTWHGRWKGQASVVRTPERALSAIGAIELDQACREAGL